MMPRAPGITLTSALDIFPGAHRMADRSPSIRLVIGALSGHKLLTNGRLGLKCIFKNDAQGSRDHVDVGAEYIS